jgi:hypothetical protein
LEALEDRTLPAVSVPQLFVADIYVTELGRGGSDTEIAASASELLPGFTGTDVAKQILSTRSFQAAEIRQLYATFAGIDPGSDAVSFWLDLLTQPGNTMDTVRIDFLGSDIYYNRVGGTNAAYVSALFADVWNKPVDAALLNQFVSELNSGTPRKEVAAAFVTDLRGYQAQVAADYDKVLDRPPSPISLSFFASFRQNGGANEQILAQLHGSSELMKHMQFFLNPPGSHVPFSDSNIAAATFRAQLKSQIANQQMAEMKAVMAAQKAQQDAANAATDEMDAAQQVQNAITNSMGPAEQTPNDATDTQEDAPDAATDAQKDYVDASGKDSDALHQVGIAKQEESSAEPSSTTMQAVDDAVAAEAAASMSATKAQADAKKAQMGASAAQNCGMSTDLRSYLMCLDSTAAGAATDAGNAKSLADQLADDAADAAFPEPSPPDDSANDVDTVSPNMSARDLAHAAMNAMQMAPQYSAGSQAALFIDEATAEAQAAQTAAGFSAAFANDADMDRNTVGQKDMEAHSAATGTKNAVGKALSELTQLENFSFFSDPSGFFTLLNNFFTDYNTAVTQEGLALQADNDAQAYLQTNPRNVSLDKQNADTQLLSAQGALMQTKMDITLAAQAAAANPGNNHEGDDKKGDREGGNHVG